jgi:hypothetical protein
MGNTHGVNASNNPAVKKPRIISHHFPLFSKLAAWLSLSEALLFAAMLLAVVVA